MATIKRYENQPWIPNDGTIIINNSLVDRFTGNAIPYSNSSGNLIEDPSDFNYDGLSLEVPAIADNFKIVNRLEGSIAGFNVTAARELHVLDTAATSDTTLDIPEGAMLLGVQFNVDEAITTDGGDDTWEAAFIGGSTTTLAAAATAGTVDTKVNLLIVPEIASAETNIQFTAGNSEDFSAGSIEVIVYYAFLTAMDDV